MKTLRIFAAFLALTISTFAFASPVNINTADAPTLSKNIKGVGLKKAQTIVDYREKNGKFSKIEDIMKVKGIGKKLFEKNASSIIIEN